MHKKKIFYFNFVISFQSFNANLETFKVYGIEMCLLPTMFIIQERKKVNYIPLTSSYSTFDIILHMQDYLSYPMREMIARIPFKNVMESSILSLPVLHPDAAS